MRATLEHALCMPATLVIASSGHPYPLFLHPDSIRVHPYPLFHHPDPSHKHPYLLFHHPDP